MVTVPAGDAFPLAVQESGRPDGPPLLLLSGQANSHRWWRRLRTGFDDAFRVISLDWRGTGDSRGEVGSWTTRLFAEDAATVLDALGVRSAGVYATSMGGRVAQHLAADRPDLVGRLVLVCTSSGGPHAVERSLEVRRDLGHRNQDHRREVLQRLFYTEAWPHPPTASTLFGDPTMTREESVAHLRASGRHDAWDRLPLILAPTLVVHGSADLMVPAANAPLLAERIPGAELVVHEGGRHGFFDEYAAEVTPLVRTFLTGSRVR